MTIPAETGRRRGFPIGWILLAVLVAALVVRTVDILLVLFLAVILAVYLEAVSDFLRRRFELPEALGLTIGIVLSLGAITGAIFLIVPAVADQVK
ncbi:MAG: hypothetical protein H0W67_09820, partial [Gemmatimonadales bacterium]|nr:hypothetical protein [Gemmatimonadales bacterium]